MTTPATSAPDAPTTPVVPQETVVDATQFDGLTVSVRRNADKGQWEAYIVVGGVEWTLASRKLGGFDDDLQEAATPGFLEKRRLYYEREVLGLR
jgi:hypothetical protein